MGTKFVLITIDNYGRASVSEDPVKVDRPSPIIWQLHPANRKNWKLVGIEIDTGSGPQDQLHDWTEVPGHDAISALDICTKAGDIKYSVLYARKHPTGSVQRLDPTIRNDPPQISLKMMGIDTQPASNEKIIPVDIDEDGNVLSPAKDDVCVVKGKKGDEVKVKWMLTASSKQFGWIFHDFAWVAPAPPADEFTGKTINQTTLLIKDKNETAGEFGYTLVYKKKQPKNAKRKAQADNLLAFDPTIRNVPE
jgi:hypothetical protein